VSETKQDLIEALRELQSPWLDAAGAAAYLQFSERYFRMKVSVQPDFPAPRYLAGTTMRWDRRELDHWADMQTQKYKAPVPEEEPAPASDPPTE